MIAWLLIRRARKSVLWYIRVLEWWFRERGVLDTELRTCLLFHALVRKILDLLFLRPLIYVIYIRYRYIIFIYFILYHNVLHKRPDDSIVHRFIATTIDIALYKTPDFNSLIPFYLHHKVHIVASLNCSTANCNKHSSSFPWLQVLILKVLEYFQRFLVILYIGWFHDNCMSPCNEFTPYSGLPQ